MRDNPSPNAMKTLTNRNLRRVSALAAFAIALFFLIPLASAPAQTHDLDYLLVGGRIVDGTGSFPRLADVGIRGDRIAFIGNAASAHVHAKQTFSAKGLIICPGFIDPHTHADGYLNDPVRHSNLNYIMQGVTTVVVGNDGGGP